MTRDAHDIQRLLQELELGRLDALSPDDVAALEQHLNADDQAAARLADRRPPRDERLSLPAAQPTAAEWDRMWQVVAGSATESAPLRKSTGRPRRWLRLVEGVTAAAACVALAALWHGGASTEALAAEWPMQLSENVEVESLEVFGDQTSFVLYPDDGSGQAVIWVIEEPSGA